jgi:hypothetical protein
MYITAGKIQLIAAIAETALSANGREDTSMHHAMDNNADHITRTFGFHCREFGDSFRQERDCESGKSLMKEEDGRRPAYFTAAIDVFKFFVPGAL